MCEFDWDIISKYSSPILAFFAGFIPVYFAGKRRAKELKEELTANNKFRKIELDYKRAEFIYTQKHKGYEDLLKIISKNSIETTELLHENLLPDLFISNILMAINNNDNDRINNAIFEFNEKIKFILNKYIQLHNTLLYEIQPSILNSSDEVYRLIETLKNKYDLIFKDFTKNILPNISTLSTEEFEKKNNNIKQFEIDYLSSFDDLKEMMRKEIKEEEKKIKSNIS